MPRPGVPSWYAGLLAAVAIQRVVELAISRSHEVGRPARRAASGSYPVMVAAHVGLLTLPLLEVRGDRGRRPRGRWAAVLAAAQQVRGQLARLANLSPGEATMANGRIGRAGTTEGIPIADVMGELRAT